MLILEGLADSSTGSISADDQQLTKFHGLYQQDDRDVRNERRKHKLDKAYSFLARIGARWSGHSGTMAGSRWIANYCAFNTLKLTTRQAFQLHGILKSNLKNVIQTVTDVSMSTLMYVEM